MRHKYKGRKLGSDYSHTKAMKVSLTQALFLNDRIKTTETRAKEIRRNVDKIVTWAKKGDLHSRRLAISALGNNADLVREIFEKVNQGMFENRPGGYTRILKLGPRKGDGAQMVIIELVNETCVPKADRKAAAAKSTTSKAKATPSKKEKKEDVKEAEEKIKAEEEKAEEHHESVIEKIHDNIEAAEETFAENVQKAGEEQLAEEEAEAKKDEQKEARENEKAEEENKEKAEEAEEKRAEEAAAIEADKVEKSQESHK